MRRLEVAVVVGAGARATEDVSEIVLSMQRCEKGSKEHRRLGDLLIRRLQPVLKRVARSVKDRGAVGLDDLVQVAAMAALRAVDAYRVGSSQSFEACVEWWAKQPCWDYVHQHRADVHVSEGADRGRTKDEATDVLVVSRDALKRSWSMDRGDDAPGGPRGRAMESEESFDVTAHNLLESEQNQVLVRRFVKKLPYPMRDLVAAYHGIGDGREKGDSTSLRAMEAQLGESRTRVTKLLRRGEALLRKMLEREFAQRRVKR